MAIFLNGTEIKELQVDSVNLGTVYLNGVLVARKPTITTQPVGGSITNSQTKTLTVVADGLGSTLSYQWYKNGAAISGATATSYTFDPTSTGTFAFYCRVHGFSGYTDTSSVNVVVNSAAPTITTQPTGGTIYDTQTKALTVVADGHGASLKYQWYKDGAAISGATSSSYTFDPSSVGSFKFFCRVTTSGYVDTNMVTVTVEKYWSASVVLGHDSYASGYIQGTGVAYLEGNVKFGSSSGSLKIGGVSMSMTTPTSESGMQMYSQTGSVGDTTNVFGFPGSGTTKTGKLYISPDSLGKGPYTLTFANSSGRYESNIADALGSDRLFAPSDEGETIKLHWEDN